MSSKSSKITEVKTRKRGMKLEPLKAEFQHGKVDPTVVGDVEVGLYSDSLSDDYVAVSRVGDTAYMGTVESNQMEPQRTFLAIRNKATKSVKLVELGKVSLMPVVPFPRSLNPMLIEDEEEEEEKPSKQTKTELHRGFVQRFGMLKGQRLYDQAKRLTVAASTVRANLEHAASQTSVDHSELVPAANDTFDYLLPSRNTEASRGSEVYQLSDIFTDEDMASLNDLAEYLVTVESSEIQSWRKENHYSPYFTSRLELLKRPNRMEAEEQKRFIAAITFAELLIKLANLKPFALQRKDPLPGDFPSDVRRRVLERYVPFKAGKRIFSQVDRERVICHLMVVLFITGDCFIDVKLLADSLNMEIEKLKPLVLVVGAHYSVDKVSGVSRASLRVPLASPPKKAFVAKKKGGRK